MSSQTVLLCLDGIYLRHYLLLYLDIFCGARFSCVACLQAMLQYNPETKSVQLIVDRDVQVRGHGRCEVHGSTWISS